MKVRINKFLSQNNVASRRKIDYYIDQKRIYVNGKPAKKGDLVDEKDTILLDGTELNIKETNEEDCEYILMYKPTQVLSAVSDMRKRTTVTELIESQKHLYPVGRLDFMSEGLIILTNDGEFAFKMTHPKFHVPKKYYVETEENIELEQVVILEKGGIPIEDKITSGTQIEILDPNKFNITLFEGIKRQIRVSCQFVGLTVTKLKRLSMGELKLGDLKPGEFRKVSETEMEYIKYIKSL